MFSIQRNFENSLRSSNDFSPNSGKNRINPHQHTKCKGKVHGTGVFSTPRNCDKNHIPKKKTSSVSSDNLSDTDESKHSKDEVDEIGGGKYVDDDGLWVREVVECKRSEKERQKNDWSRVKAVVNKDKLSTVVEDNNPLNWRGEKDKLGRKISGPVKFSPDPKYQYVPSRVGSFRRKKKSYPEVSFEELFSEALQRKSRKNSGRDRFKDLIELVENSKNIKVRIKGVKSIHEFGDGRFCRRASCHSPSFFYSTINNSVDICVAFPRHCSSAKMLIILIYYNLVTSAVE